MQTFFWLVVFALALAILNGPIGLGIPIWGIIAIPFLPIIATLVLFVLLAAVASVVAAAALIGFIASDLYDSFRK